MNKTIFLVLIALILVVSVAYAESDSDGDGVKDEFDACNNTSPGSSLPAIRVYTEYLGCSCKQIDALLNPELECYAIFCQAGRPLEIQELSECVNKTRPVPVEPENTTELLEDETFDAYDVLLENPELKNLLGNPSRESFEAKHKVGYLYSALPELITKKIVDIDTQFSRASIIVAPDEKYVMKNLLVVVMIPQFIPMNEVIYSEEPDYVIENFAVWYDKESFGKELFVDVKSNDLINLEVYVYADSNKDLDLLIYLPYLLVLVLIFVTYLFISSSIRKHRN